MKIEKSSSNYLIIDSGTAMTFDNQAALQLKVSFDQFFYCLYNGVKTLALRRNL